MIKSTTEFISLLRTYEIGDMVSIGLIRNDKEMSIETKLIETSWPVTKWSETHTYSGDSESTEVSWKVDFIGKGVGNLFFPFFNAYLGSDIKKSLKNLKKIIEG